MRNSFSLLICGLIWAALSLPQAGLAQTPDNEADLAQAEAAALAGKKLGKQGKFLESAEQFLLAAELNPEKTAHWCNAGLAFYGAQVFDIAQPFLATCYAMTGDRWPPTVEGVYRDVERKLRAEGWVKVEFRTGKEISDLRLWSEQYDRLGELGQIPIFVAPGLQRFRCFGTGLDSAPFQIKVSKDSVITCRSQNGSPATESGAASEPSHKSTGSEPEPSNNDANANSSQTGTSSSQQWGQPSQKKSRWQANRAWVALGASAGLAAVSGFFWYRAARLNDQAKTDFSITTSDIRKYEIPAWITTGASVGALGLGMYWLFRQDKSKEKHASTAVPVGLQAISDGAIVSWNGVFE